MTADEELPDPVAGNREELADRLDACDRLFLGLDFDGTLAPIEEDPDAPTITPECRRPLSILARNPSVTVAVVSGRALADVRPRVGLPEVVYAGNHGLELERGDEREVHPDAREARPALERAVERLRERLDEVPGTAVEDKELTATVHYRQTPRSAVDEVESIVRDEAPADDEALELSEGKESIEVRPAVDRDKGTAVRDLLDREDGDPLAMFVGDDVTDEDAFRAIEPGGIGVLVGSRPDSAADYRVPSQEAVAPLLRWLATTVPDRPDPEELSSAANDD